MRIRDAIIEDVTSIAEVHIEAWRTAYRGILPNTYLDTMCIQSISKQWQDALKITGPGKYLVIEDGGNVSGFCVFGPARDKDLASLNVGELVALNILPTKWRNGLASILIKYVVKSASVYKWSSLFLWVIKENVGARNLYEAMDFKLEGQEKTDTALTGCILHEVRYVLELN